MNSMPVREIMTKDVITIRSFVPFRRIAATMLSRGIGAVPVVDSMGHAIGVVSRTDLIAKQAANSGQPELWELLSRRGRQTHARGEATSAGHLMTTELVTVTPNTEIARAAYLMERHAVTHLPVVDERNVIVGIVARSDLLRAYLRDDAEIRRDVAQVLHAGLPGAERETVAADVEDGIVTLSGATQHRTAAHLAHNLREIRGVVDVIDKTQPRDDEAAAGDGFSPGPLF
ncbi:MAG TPA: CBS domain-containing protein [Actinocrinis sp.]|nr:CBS domain-containing protein [Actinocrinis sp.]